MAKQLIQESNNEVGELKGEISGVLLLALVSSFRDLNIFKNGKVPFIAEELVPSAWYPYEYFINTLKVIENSTAISEAAQFQAGIYFIDLWYRKGPGKDLIHSTMDWLHANDESAGYNSVVRGGLPEEIGWCKTLQIDEANGIATIENVMPIKGEFIRGLFYGGCRIFKDMCYVRVDVDCQPYISNSLFSRTVVKVFFIPKSADELTTRIDNLGWQDNLPLDGPDLKELVWQYKDLKHRFELREQYHAAITDLLASAFRETNALRESLATNNDKLSETNRELEKTLNELNVLRGIIPICSYCKNIRTDEGAWEQVEAYVTKHSDAVFTHSVCPKCYAEVMEELKSEDEKS